MPRTRIGANFANSDSWSQSERNRVKAETPCEEAIPFLLGQDNGQDEARLFCGERGASDKFMEPWGRPSIDSSDGLSMNFKFRPFGKLMNDEIPLRYGINLVHSNHPLKSGHIIRVPFKTELETANFRTAMKLQWAAVQLEAITATADPKDVEDLSDDDGDYMTTSGRDDGAKVTIKTRVLATYWSAECRRRDKEKCIVTGADVIQGRAAFGLKLLGIIDLKEVILKFYWLKMQRLVRAEKDDLRSETQESSTSLIGQMIDELPMTRDGANFADSNQPVRTGHVVTVAFEASENFNTFEDEDLSDDEAGLSITTTEAEDVLSTKSMGSPVSCRLDLENLYFEEEAENFVTVIKLQWAAVQLEALTAAAEFEDEDPEESSDDEVGLYMAANE
ncbi:hypothetical protein CDD80_4420 [Ophiocordyceps camponoti-rufipedis]|uniref:Uncharacterized protein n=1 Tax=Ophiocordyceps camponoti-rufipedis TaxID=2004952 RepID=A0A2C5YY77_9HYPO|nr:hypothetical protein CDD80_4420 [Ophiocordyceps camponoti-rufipedis]